MALNNTLFVISLLVLVISVLQTYSKPLEASASTAVEQTGEDMEVAEAHAFLPIFAMRKLKERRQQAQAQRRNNQGQRRANPPRVKCPPQRQRQYYKK